MIKNDVIFGKDNTLFLNQGGHFETDLLSMKKKPSSDSINNFKNNIHKRIEYCNYKNIKFLHVIHPSKQLVYKELLPTDYENLISVYESYFTTGYSENILYLLNDLLKSKNDKSLYRKLDTHLSDFGALVCSKAILEKLNINSSEMMKNFHKKNRKLSGDLALMADIDELHEELTFEPNFKYFVSDNRNLLNRNKFHTIITRNKYAITDQRLLIFADSFLIQSIKFFSLYFKEILFVRSSTLQKDLIDLFCPDIVLTGNTERYLKDVPNDDRSKSFLLDQIENIDYKSNSSHQYSFNSILSVKNYNFYYSKWKKFVDVKYLSKNLEVKITAKNNENNYIVNSEDYLHFSGDVKNPIKQIYFDISSKKEATCKIIYTSSSKKEIKEISCKLKNGKNIIGFEIDSPILDSIKFHPSEINNEITINGVKIV